MVDGIDVRDYSLTKLRNGVGMVLQKNVLFSGTVAEYLRIGVPMGVAIFMETSIFGVVALFIAKFGTEVIAAHQAALNFSSLIYMFPMSFSLALTILCTT